MYQDWMDKIPVIEDINNCNNVSRMDESMPIIISDDKYICYIKEK